MIFDHIGIFVPTLKDGREQISTILPIAGFSESFEDANLQVCVQFCTDRSGIRYEIVAPFGKDNPVSAVLAGGKAVLNHVAYQVDDIDAAFDRMRNAGSVPFGPPKSAVAFDGRRVAFLLTPMRFIIELIEADRR